MRISDWSSDVCSSDLLVAGLAVDDQLGDQAVVGRGDAVAGVEPGIDAHAEPAGGVVVGDPARRGHEGLRVLGVDAAFDGVAGKRDVARSEEHTSELQSLMRISYAVFFLKKKNITYLVNNKSNLFTKAHN